VTCDKNSTIIACVTGYANIATSTSWGGTAGITMDDVYKTATLWGSCASLLTESHLASKTIKTFPDNTNAVQMAVAIYT